jgi:hypothetical protein
MFSTITSFFSATTPRPADGRGVWVLKYEQADDLPDDFGKVRMAADMEEKIEAMKALGAEFVADPDESRN